MSGWMVMTLRCVVNRLGAKLTMRVTLYVTSIVVLAGCVRIPEGITPVKSFDQSRYLGPWYEIARLDHSFERGLSSISATYTVREDGHIRVVNRGYDPEEGIWRDVIGVAKFVDTPDVAHLKVSFFGPFYGSYVVFELGESYHYALVTSYSRDYFWFLSRTPTVDETLRQHVLERAQALGFATEEMIWLSQAMTPKDPIL